VIAGIGVDIVEVQRIAAAVQRHGDRFLTRVFTPGEIAYCQGEEPHRSRRLAARFAAKEAVLKALGTGLRGGRWTEIEVVSDSLGKPTIRLSGALAAVAAHRGISRWHLSLSHSQAYAVAQVVAEGGGGS
jgi:holo-[acyl-carrier protein] synthase